MAARDDILTAIRDHSPAPLELPHVPDFSQAPVDLTSLFTATLKGLDGHTVPHPADFPHWANPGRLPPLGRTGRRGRHGCPGPHWA